MRKVKFGVECKDNNGLPVYEKRTGYFHRWYLVDGKPHAVCEGEDGHVYFVWYGSVTFEPYIGQNL